MTRNRELFDKIADQIERHPETYDQDVIHHTTPCGTAYCIAGHAVTLSGHTIKDNRDEYGRPALLTASGLLGLTNRESRYLFDMNWLPPAGMTVPEALRAIGRGEIDP